MHEIVDRLSNIATRCRKAALINKLTKNSPHGKFFVGIASYLIARSPPARGSWYTREPVVAFHRYLRPLGQSTAQRRTSSRRKRDFVQPKADDGLISRPPFPTEAEKYQLSLLRR